MFEGTGAQATDTTFKLSDGKPYYLSIRPFAIEMLKDLKRHCELVVFTASYKSYAEAVVSILHKLAGQKLFEHVVSRDFCTQMPYIQPIEK